ncbi:MAG TPA: hypothetical protein PKA53_14280, partial [Sphingobacterium sp.]|nr:hypothetical protein [Sphingobacterium sp.]
MKKKTDFSRCRSLVFVLLGLSLTFHSYAQEDLKSLREKPETKIVSPDTTKKIEINPVKVPIPE